MIYLFDTNAMSDLLRPPPDARQWATARRIQGHTLGICRPVYYELLRGLFWRQSTGKQAALSHRILPLFVWLALTDNDWDQAAYFWSNARGKGYQLSDPDLLLAALAFRLSAIIVSADTDFDILPVKREDWRVT